MRICCAQLTQEYDNPDAAFRKAETYIRENPADMILFPEQFATGWRPDTPKFSGEEIKNRWLKLAKDTRTCIVGSYLKPAGDKPQNVMLVCSPEGKILAEYAKIHLFCPGGEDKTFSPGNNIVTFEYGGLKFGCAVCFDLRFPELFREYLKEKVDCVIIQAAWLAARVADWELLLRARALENRNYVVACGCLGYDPVMQTECSGRSLVCDTEGRIIEDAGIFEGGLTWDIDASGVKDDVATMRGRWIFF